jgi:hypothetical protein
VKLFWAAFAACLLGSAGARAAESATDRALAEALFRDARALMDQGQAARACPKLVESYRLDPQLGTLLNLAVCHEQAGQLASAWARYGEAAALARQKGDPARQAFAEDGARRLDGRFATLAISLSPAFTEIRDLRFVLDHRELGRAVVDTPIPVDPGTHELVVQADGYSPWSQTLEVSPASPPAPLPGAAPPLPPPAATAPAVPPAPAESATPGSTQRFWGLVAGATGVAGVGVSLGFGAHALSEKHSRDDLCPNGRCSTQAGVDAHRSANTAATIANVAGVAGAALLGTGLVLYFTAPHATAGSTGGARSLSLGWGSVAWEGTWD